MNAIMDAAALEEAGQKPVVPDFFGDYMDPAKHTANANVNYAGLIPLAWSIGTLTCLYNTVC